MLSVLRGIPSPATGSSAWISGSKKASLSFAVPTACHRVKKDTQGRQRGPLAPHGYGLKIIDRILKQAGGFSRIETETGRFQITFALPLQ